MDAIALLKDDHKAVEKLFKQFEKLGDDASPASKKNIVDQVITLLTQHAHIEENIFYPAARTAAPDTKEHVLESVEEHHVVAWMLSELRGADPSDEAYEAKMTVLMENVRHHVEEEEKEWFPQVRKAMPRQQLQDLSDRMQAAKADAPSNPLDLPSASSSAKDTGDDAQPTPGSPAAAPVKKSTAAKSAAKSAPAKATAGAKTATKAAAATAKTVKATVSSAAKSASKSAAKPASKATATKKAAKPAAKSSTKSTTSGTATKSAKKSGSKK
jgi:hemerythrin superfamily protein